MSSGRPVRSNRSAISWALLHEPSEGEEVVPEEHGSAWDDDDFFDEVHATPKRNSRSASSRQPSDFDPQSQQSQQSQQSTAGDDPQTQTTDDVTDGYQPVLTAHQRQQLSNAFPLLKRSLADSKQELHALAKRVGVSQRDCTAAFSQHLRDIHPVYVLSGQHRFTTDEANALDEQFRSESRWRVGGTDVNLATLADEAAKNLNRSRPQGAPQLTGDMVLNRRQLFRRSMTTQGVLADVALPGLVALAHYFSKQLRTTIAILQSCVDDERVVDALDSADRDKVFMENYLKQFSASIGEILQFARRQVQTQSEHDISNRRFQFQTLSETVVRNDIDVRRNQLYAVCDDFVRRNVAHHLGIDSVAKDVHQLMFDCAWAAMGDAGESLPPQQQAFEPVADEAYTGLRLYAEEYARLDHVVAFSMAHLGAGVCAQYGLGVQERDFDDAQDDDDDDDDDDGVVKLVGKLIGSAPALYNMLGYALATAVHDLKLARAHAPEKQRMNAWALAQMCATEKEKKTDLALKTAAMEQHGNLVYPAPAFFWCVAFPIALLAYAVVYEPRDAHDIERITSLIHAPIVLDAMTRNLQKFNDTFLHYPRGLDNDQLRKYEKKVTVLACRVIDAFFRCCCRDLAHRFAKPATLKRSAEASKSEDAGGARQLTTTKMVSGKEVASAKRKKKSRGDDSDEDDD